MRGNRYVRQKAVVCETEARRSSVVASTEDHDPITQWEESDLSIAMFTRSAAPSPEHRPNETAEGTILASTDALER